MPTAIKEKVRVKYIPTSESYRGIKLSASIQGRGEKVERVSLIPNQWMTISRSLATHLKKKVERMKRGVDVLDGEGLEARMETQTDKGKMVNQAFADFELIIEGE